MKHGALGESQGVTQNPPACQPGCQADCKPHGPDRASEPLRTWSSPSAVSVPCPPKGVGSKLCYPAFLKTSLHKEVYFYWGFSYSHQP